MKKHREGRLLANKCINTPTNMFSLQVFSLPVILGSVSHTVFSYTMKSVWMDVIFLSAIFTEWQIGFCLVLKIFSLRMHIQTIAMYFANRAFRVLWSFQWMIICHEMEAIFVKKERLIYGFLQLTVEAILLYCKYGCVCVCMSERFLCLHTSPTSGKSC